MVLPAPRKPVSTVTGAVSAMRVAAVQAFRAKPVGAAISTSPPSRGGAEEAGAAAGVARDASWWTSSSSVSPSQSTRSSFRCCTWPGGLALAPQRVAAAAEVADPAGGERLAPPRRGSSRRASAPRRCRAAGRWRGRGRAASKRIAASMSCSLMAVILGLNSPAERCRHARDRLGRRSAPDKAACHLQRHGVLADQLYRRQPLHGDSRDPAA